MENVLVRLCSTQVLQDGTRDHMAKESPGTLSHENGAAVLRYTEVTEEGDRTENELRIYGARVVLKRSGSAQMNMIFAEGREGAGIYRSPYGSFSMNYMTRSLSKEERPGGIGLSLSYSLFLNGAPHAECRIGIDAEIL